MNQHDPPADAAIIAASLQRPGEFTELYRRHADVVFRYALSRLGRDHAEDTLSETFLVGFERRESFDTTVTSALPWLLGIATRLIRRRRRDEVAAWKLRNRLDGLGGEASHRVSLTPADDVDERIDADRTARAIEAAMQKLPQRDRDVLALSAWSELDSVGIAAALNIPVGTVRSRLHRARRQLQTQLTLAGARQGGNQQRTRTTAPNQIETAITTRETENDHA